MNVGTAHSEVNPNTRVMNSRGIWLSYVLGIGLLHVVLLSIPFFSVPVVWTLTNIIHNMVRGHHSYLAPWGTPSWARWSHGWLALQGVLLRDPTVKSDPPSPEFLRVCGLESS